MFRKLKNQPIFHIVVHLKRYSFILIIGIFINIVAIFSFFKDFLYELKNLSITDKFLIPSLPVMNFTNVIEFSESNEIIATFITKGGIVAKSKKST